MFSILRELGDEVVFTAHSQGLVVYHTSFGTRSTCKAPAVSDIFFRFRLTISIC